MLNTDAVVSHVKISEQNNIHLVYLSTHFVFHGLDGQYLEDALPNPLSFYGRSKFAVEQAMINSNCKQAIVRIIWVYGFTPNTSRSNIVLCTKSSLESGTLIKIVNDQWCMPTLVINLAEACALIAESHLQAYFMLVVKI